jgi:hypothetical protein
VIDRLLRLGGRCRLVPLLGNHEEALLDALRDKGALRRWLTLGGPDTLRSYGWAPGGPRRRWPTGSPRRTGHSSRAARTITRRQPTCSSTPGMCPICRWANSRDWPCGGE